MSSISVRQTQEHTLNTWQQLKAGLTDLIMTILSSVILSEF